MGIAPYKYFTFDGESSRNYDVYLTGTGVFNAPQRAVDLLEIPGRNGNYALDQGRFNNITVTYKAGIVDYSESDFADKVSAVRNWLCSKVGYVRLTDDYNPDEYRMAVFKNGITVDHDDLKTGEFEITFECKPQRWLTSGETPIEIGAWHDVQTLSGDIVQFSALETDKVKSLVADIDPIQDLHGYDAPWVGGVGKNKLKYPYYDSSGSQNGITWTVNSDGTFTLSGTANAETIINISNSVTPYVIGSGTQQVVTSAEASYNPNISGLNFQTDIYKDGTYTGTVQRNNASIQITNATEIGIGQSRLRIANGTVIPNNTVFYPQIELGQTPTAWQPYSNICPISGWSGVDVVDCGINLWDEEWELGGIGDDGNNTPNNSRIRSKNYIPIAPNTTYYFKNGTATMWLWAYDGSKTYIGRLNGGNSIGNATLTIPDGVKYIRFVCTNAYGTTYNNDISINYPSTDHDYHAYNGTTISVQFKDENDNVLTVYGGRDEIIGGELTVTHGRKVFDGTENWHKGGAKPASFYCYWSEIGGVKNKPFLCSHAVMTSSLSVYKLGECYSDNACSLYIQDDVNMTEAQFKQMLADMYSNGDPLQICYELATPTTYTLTAQQVDLLVGQNTVFADTGDVTLEYGQNPMVLINPTPFEAEPLLAIKGYGTIDFNGYEVEIENGELGTIQLANNNTMSTDTVTISLSNTSSLNLGDTIYFSRDLIDSSVGIRADNLNSVINSSTLTSSSNVVAHPKLIRNSRYDFSVKLVADMSARFVYGTSSTITSTATFSAETWDETNITISASLTVVYDGDDTITVTRAVSVVGKTMVYLYPSMTIDEIYGDSTVNFLGNPTYIDCDLGECYKYESGEIVSLNGVIALGSDLPKLSSGANTFTMDGTVTELKVTPRWWKV